MGSTTLSRVELFVVFLLFSIFTFIIAEDSSEIVGTTDHNRNSVLEVDHEYVNVSVLDTRRDVSYSWEITQGISGSDWFDYFENVNEIPVDVDYGGILPYNVGFPTGFVKEDFLVQSDAVGIWMMVNADVPPKYPDYGASVNLSGHHSKPEFNRVNITCYLGGDSSLTVTLFNNNNFNETYTFHNNQSSKKENWDHFSIESTILATRLTTKVRAEDNSSFVMVEKIIVGKYAPKVTTTKRPIHCTTPQEDITTNAGTDNPMSDVPTDDASESDSTDDSSSTTESSTAISSSTVQECIIASSTTKRPTRPTTTTRKEKDTTTVSTGESDSSSTSSGTSAVSTTTESPVSPPKEPSTSTTKSNKAHHFSGQVITVAWFTFVMMIL